MKKRGKPTTKKRRKSSRVSVKAYLRNGKIVQGYQRKRGKLHTRKVNGKLVKVRGYTPRVRIPIDRDELARTLLEAELGAEGLIHGMKAYEYLALKAKVSENEAYSTLMGSPPDVGTAT